MTVGPRKALAIAALLLAGACRQPAAPAVDYSPQEAGTVDHAMCLLGFAAVPLREVSTGHHLVQATLNGEEGSFVLDTGANATVLDAAHVQRFGVSGRSAGFAGAVGVGGGGRANQVAIQALRVGEIPIRQRRIVTTDLSQLLGVMSRVTGRTVYGIIGQDVLQEHRAIIDVARPMLYLMEADRDPAPVPAERCRSGGGESKAGSEETRGPSRE